MDVEDAAAGDVGVAFGGAEGRVAEEGLDVTDVGAAFEEVGGEGVPEAVDGNVFGDLGVTDGAVKNALGGTDGQMVGWGLAGEKPVLNIVKGAVLGKQGNGFF